MNPRRRSGSVPTAIGNDVFLQLMYGLGTSLYIGLVAGLVATLIGVTIGTLSGYIGGLVDEILMGFTNILITVPTIVVLVLLSVALQNRSTLLLGVIIGVTSWPWTARAVRAQTSSLKTRETCRCGQTLRGQDVWNYHQGNFALHGELRGDGVRVATLERHLKRSGPESFGSRPESKHFTRENVAKRPARRSAEDGRVLGDFAPDHSALHHRVFALAPAVELRRVL